MVQSAAGELVKQSLLLDLFALLCPNEGEFWYMESHAGEAVHELGELGRMWWERAQRDEGLQSLPLWRCQRAAMEDGQQLGTGALSMKALWRAENLKVAMRWLFCHPTGSLARSMGGYIAGWLEKMDASALWAESPHRFYQVIGKGHEALQEIVYLGGARAPGLALLEPGELFDDFSHWIFLMETLLVRRFWVVLVLPLFSEPHQERIASGVYNSFYRGVCNLQTPGAIFRLYEAQQTRSTHEIWVLSPGQGLSQLLETSQEHAELLLAQGLGWREEDNKVRGLEIEEIPHLGVPDSAFFSQFPCELDSGLWVDEAKEEDLEEVIRLWERLMDEHAVLDGHFRRRPLARLYLRRSFRSQLFQPDYLLLVVRKHRRVVGFLSAQVLRAPLFQESRFGQIVDVYILPDWRGQKLGSALVQGAFAWFRQLNLSQVDLNVAVENVRAKAFWEKQGFASYLNVVSCELSDKHKHKHDRGED